MNEMTMLESSGMDIPDSAIERIARCLLPLMQASMAEESQQDGEEAA